MKRRNARFLLLVLLIGAASAVASAFRTNETLVGTSPTLLPQRPARTRVEIQDLGPNPIFCAVGDSSKAIVGKSRRVDADGGVWYVPHLAYSIPIYCVTTVAQVTGGGTITTEFE